MISPDISRPTSPVRARTRARGTSLPLRLGQRPRHRAALRPDPQERASPRWILLSLALDIEPRRYDHPQERALGRQRASRRIPEIIHAHRQRTGRMESHLWLESAGEVTRKLKSRGRCTKRLRCRARLLRNKDNRTLRTSMKVWPTRFRGQVSRYSCLTLGAPPCLS